jgi:predicted house-cleaning noncanonical NTP pyrophosphatase (MazG superfamily)
VDELPLALLAKLREETAELAAARGEDVVEELADVLEVVRSLSAVLGIAWSDVLATAKRKAEERGGFDRGLMLVDVDVDVDPS